MKLKNAPELTWMGVGGHRGKGLRWPKRAGNSWVGVGGVEKAWGRHSNPGNTTTAWNNDLEDWLQVTEDS